MINVGFVLGRVAHIGFMGGLQRAASHIGLTGVETDPSSCVIKKNHHFYTLVNSHKACVPGSPSASVTPAYFNSGDQEVVTENQFNDYNYYNDQQDEDRTTAGQVLFSMEKINNDGDIRVTINLTPAAHFGFLVGFRTLAILTGMLALGVWTKMRSPVNLVNLTRKVRYKWLTLVQ